MKARALAGSPTSDDVTVELVVHETFLYDSYDAHAPEVLPEPDQPTTEQLEALGLPSTFASTGRNDGRSAGHNQHRREGRSTVFTCTLSADGNPVALPGFPPSSCSFCQQYASEASSDTSPHEALQLWDRWYSSRRAQPSPDREEIARLWANSGDQTPETQWEIAWRFHTAWHCAGEEHASAIDLESRVEGSCAEDDSVRPAAELNRYWRQRYRLFSRFDEGVKLDHESWYSVTPEVIARHIAQRCGPGRVVVDAFCGSGGNAIAFAVQHQDCYVVAIDLDPTKIENARHNAGVYRVADRIEFVCADCLELLPRLHCVDVLFLSPPWGGPAAMRDKTFDLSTMFVGVHDGFSLFRIASTVAANIVYFLPRNSKLEQVAMLSQMGCSACHVEKQHLNNKLKTMSVYFGDIFGHGGIDLTPTDEIEDDSETVASLSSP